MECIARLVDPWDEVHLDHDLGGEIYVDSSREDCGMEVVRWLCLQPKEPLLATWFFVHSHNADAAVEMVQSLRRHGYQAVYRPFGIDVLTWFTSPPENEAGLPPPERIPHPPAPTPPPARPGWLTRQLRWLRGVAPPEAHADPTDLPGDKPSRENRIP